MKKQILCLLAVLCLLLTCFIGCSSENDTPRGSRPENTTAPPSAQSTDGLSPDSTDPSQEETTADDASASGGTSDKTQDGDPTSGNGTPAGPTGSSGQKPSLGTTRSTTDSSRRPTTTTTVRTNGPTLPGDLSFFKLGSPLHGEQLTTLTPTFSWEKATNAVSYTLLIEEYQANGTFKKKLEKSGIAATSYKLPTALTANAIYRWSVTAVNGNKTMTGYSDNGDSNIFMSKVDAGNHPANKGFSFSVNGKVSETVLRNYLSRSMIACLFGTGRTEEDLRMIYYTGAKYIGRAEISWAPNGAEYKNYPTYKQQIAAAHKVDPDLVFEACIFETVFKSVEEIPIPSWVFEAFGQKVENRNFKYDNMIFTDGTFVNHWGTNASVPDMTRIETQMFFYYRACTYIDMGFEGLHMGQVHLIGAHDSGHACWQKMLNMVRAYAKTHARRGFVFINAHTHGLKGPDGKLLFDFHSYPYRGIAPDGSVSHLPTEENPQRIELRVKASGYDAIYKDSLGGTTYSGWSCSSLPYFVELDNWAGYDINILDKPVYGNIHHWGFDEISWFANQPQWYRHQWLNYAYDWVHTTDPAGYAQMPGNRTAALRSVSDPYKITQLSYYCNNSIFDVNGFDDENAIRNIWVNDRNSR